VTTDSAPDRRPHRAAGIWLALLLALSLAAPPASVAQEAGAGAFSRLGFGARGIALGNALGADPTADVSTYYNPALAAQASEQRLAASAALMSFDRELQFLEFTTPLGPTAGLGIGLIHAGVSGIDGRDANGNRTEELSTDEFNVFLSFGNQFADRFSVGATLQIYQADFADDLDAARTFAVDLGTLVDVTDRLRLALSVNDILAKYEWDGTGGRSNTDRFPLRVRAGASYTLLDGRLHLLGEVESRTVERDFRQREVVVTSTGPRTRLVEEQRDIHSLRGRVGARYELVDILRVRAGVDRIGVDGTAGVRPSAGFGLDQTIGNLDLRVGYAIALEPYLRDAMNLVTLEIYL
jgi:hypothetical protein